MARIDYLDDPNAPAPNSLVPSVNVVVTDDAGRILLIQRTDNGNWALPGGAMDLGETIVHAGEREVLEETGIRCEVTGIVGIYTNPDHVIEYTSDGEVRQEFSVVFTARWRPVVMSQNQRRSAVSDSSGSNSSSSTAPRPRSSASNEAQE